MLTILWNSRTGMIAQQEKLDAISNNLANIGTQGYKKVDVGFQDLVYEQLNRTGYPVTENTSSERINGTGVRTTPLTRDFSQGPLQQTNVNTDLSIDGNGDEFFQVRMPDGTIGYTRDGSFTPNAQGELVNGDGYKLVIDGLNTNFKFQNNNFTVNENGDITSVVNGKTTNVGKITLATVDRQASTANTADPLVSIGNNLYKPAQGVSMKSVNAEIDQGFLEMSNVDVSKEMTDMIITQRAFELNSKALKTADDMWGMVNNLRK